MGNFSALTLHCRVDGHLLTILINRQNLTKSFSLGIIIFLQHPDIRMNIMNSIGVSWFFSKRHWVCFRDWYDYWVTFSHRFQFLFFPTAEGLPFFNDIDLGDKEDLKNIDDRTMDSLNYYETIFLNLFWSTSLTSTSVFLLFWWAKNRKCTDRKFFMSERTKVSFKLYES